MGSFGNFARIGQQSVIRSSRPSLELLDERTKAEQAALNTRDTRVEKAAGDATLLIQIEQQYQTDLQSIRDKAAADAEQVANKQAQALQSAQLSSAQNRLDSTLHAAKKATAPTATNPVRPAHNTSDDTPRRSSTHSVAMP